MSNEPKWTPADIQWEAAGQSRPGGPVCPVTIQMVIAAKNDPKASQRLYDRLIGHYRKYPVDPANYFEVHHIIAECLGGTNDPNNLIRLPAEVHFDAHLLLVQIHVAHRRLPGLKRAVMLLFGNVEAYNDIMSHPEDMRLRYQERMLVREGKFKENLAICLDLIKAGKPRPKPGTPLSNAIGDYIKQTGNSYRPGFREALIAAGGGYWFPDLDGRYADNKRQLIALAKAGQPRPNLRDYLGTVLGNYLNESGESYRPGLKEELIAAGAVGWFYDVTFAENKRQLLQLAKAGAPRPNSMHKDKTSRYLGICLGHYTRCGERGFRPGLKEELIAAGAALWFPDVRFEDNKRLLFALIKAGKPRPQHAGDSSERYLCQALGGYLKSNAKAFRPGLKEELIAAGGGYWFPDHAGAFAAAKEQLLALAKAGEPRPRATTKLGRLLSGYVDTGGDCYRAGLKDELVAAGARKWFTDAVYAENKQQLLALARAGKPRPNKRSGNPREAYLGNILVCYLGENRLSLRPGLKEELIKAGAGHWFRAA